MKNLILILAIVNLTACGTTYKEPESGQPFAQIKFRSSPDLRYGEYTAIQHLSDEFECSYIHNTNQLSLMARLPDAKTYKIPAQKNFRVMVSSYSLGLVGFSCDIIVGFNSRQNIVYELISTFNIKNNICAAEVFEETDGNRKTLSPTQYTSC